MMLVLEWREASLHKRSSKTAWDTKPKNACEEHQGREGILIQSPPCHKTPKQTLSLFYNLLVDLLTKIHQQPNMTIKVTTPTSPNAAESCLGKTTANKKQVTFSEDKTTTDKNSFPHGKTATRPRMAKVVRFDLDMINVVEVPSVADYNFAELYRMYYRSKDYETFLREADREESSSELSPKAARPKSSLILSSTKRGKMAQKIRSTKPNLQSIIINGGSM